MLQQVFPLIQTIISKWLHVSEVVEVGLTFLFFFIFSLLLMLPECRMQRICLIFACLMVLPSQAVCGVFEKSVRTVLHDFGPMVAQLSEMLGQIYNTYPQAPALDLTRQVWIP